jgi:hypothetical protein
MKFAVEIKLTVEIKVEEITKADVIRDMAQPAKPREILMEEILSDWPFERMEKNQKLLAAIQADKKLLLRYAKALATWEALSALEGEASKPNSEGKLDLIQTSLLNRLDEADAKWFREAIDHDFFYESTDDFQRAFRVNVSEPAVKTELVSE